MKKLLISISLALLLVAAMAVPVMAEEASTTASVTVTEVISISLSGPGTPNMTFGTVAIAPGTEDVEASGQSAGTPAINVVVESGTNTNVDISITGTATGSIDIGEWEYCTTHDGTKVPLTGSYVEVYSDVGVASYAFYHWVDVPSDAPAGSQGCTIYYEAVAHS